MGRIFNYAGVKIDQDIWTQMQLDSRKFSPKYCLRKLFCEDNFPPTPTAILKVQISLPWFLSYIYSTIAISKAIDKKVAKWQIIVTFMFFCWSFKMWKLQQDMAESKLGRTLKTVASYNVSSIALMCSVC